MQLVVGNSYSFESYYQPGVVHQNWFLNGIFDYRLAAQLQDVAPVHARVLSNIPAGTVPRDPSKLKYLQFMNNAGQSVILAYEWIKEETITLFINTKIIAEVNDVSVEDLLRIRTILTQNGYTNFNVRMESTS